MNIGNLMEVTPAVRQQVFPLFDKIAEGMLEMGLSEKQAIEVFLAYSLERFVDELPGMVPADQVETVFKQVTGVLK